MDVDERSEALERGGSKAEVLFAKSEELEVTFYAHLPAEVKQILHNAGKSKILLNKFQVTV